MSAMSGAAMDLMALRQFDRVISNLLRHRLESDPVLGTGGGMGHAPEPGNRPAPGMEYAPRFRHEIRDPLRNISYDVDGMVSIPKAVGGRRTGKQATTPLFPLKTETIPGYKSLVVLSGELAVPCTRNPLYAGPNSPSRVLPRIPAALIGRRATDTREPCQVRKEAAISDGVCVADRSRSDCGGLMGEDSTRGCTTASSPSGARPKGAKGRRHPHPQAPGSSQLRNHRPGSAYARGGVTRRIPGRCGEWSGHARPLFSKRSEYSPPPDNPRFSRRWPPRRAS